VFDLARAPWVDHITDCPDLAVHLTMALMFPVTVLQVTDSWIPKIKRVLRWLMPARLIEPFLVINGYGVFPPCALAPVRLVPVFEGSDRFGGALRDDAVVSLGRSATAKRNASPQAPFVIPLMTKTSGTTTAMKPSMSIVKREMPRSNAVGGSCSWSDSAIPPRYSFRAEPESYADWDHVTLMYEDMLVWGVAPRASASVR
jgi:hypothetical protein